jgi:putative phage-type endonuclease
MTRDEWLIERRKGIGASDAAAILGLNPYSGPVAVYSDKLGIGPDVIETEAMKWGRKLEPFVAQAFAERHPEYTIETPPEYHMVWHPELNFIFCTPDYYLKPVNGAQPGFLQVKTVGSNAVRYWPDDNPPDRYLVQCIHEMACGGFEIEFLDALVGGQKEREYALTRDLTLEREIMRRLCVFWQDHVIARVPPPLDATVASDRLLKHLYPEAGQFVRQADGAELVLLSEYTAVRRELNRIGEREDELANQVKERIGTDKGLEFPGGRVLWSSVAGRRTVNWKAVAEELNAPADLIEAHTEVSAPSRRFTVKLNEENHE